jgi:hypothetical protein
MEYVERLIASVWSRTPRREDFVASVSSRTPHCERAKSLVASIPYILVKFDFHST